MSLWGQSSDPFYSRSQEVSSPDIFDPQMTKSESVVLQRQSNIFFQNLRFSSRMGLRSFLKSSTLKVKLVTLSWSHLIASFLRAFLLPKCRNVGVCGIKKTLFTRVWKISCFQQENSNNSPMKLSKAQTQNKRLTRVLNFRPEVF